MMIISYLNSSLAVSGLQVLHLLEEGMEGESGLLRESTASPVKQGVGRSPFLPVATTDRGSDRLLRATMILVSRPPHSKLRSLTSISR